MSCQGVSGTPPAHDDLVDPGAARTRKRGVAPVEVLRLSVGEEEEDKHLGEILCDFVDPGPGKLDAQVKVSRVIVGILLFDKDGYVDFPGDRACTLLPR